jgi:hypothetical protein
MIALAPLLLAGCGGSVVPSDAGPPEGGIDAGPSDGGGDAGPPDGPDAGAPDGGAICEPACDNDLFCDGAESCVDGDCSPGTAPCVGECDEAADRCLTDCALTPDADGDGHEALVCGGDDCDDSDPGVSPDAVEIVADGVDQDCDGGERCFADADLDGVATIDALVTSADLDCDDAGEGSAMAAGDCDDMDSAVHPGAVEVPGDGVDSDCDTTELCYLDADGDGYRVTDGEPIVSDDLACDGPGETSAATPGGDCDDASSAHHPGTTDLVGVGGDTDCDGLELCYVDADGDGFGTMTTVSSSRLDCSGPGEAPRRVLGGGSRPSRLPVFDCNDGDPTIRPDAIEVCNGVDDNCDGQVDARAVFGADPVRLTRPCGTTDIGACQLGTQTCVAATGTWGACTGAIGPTAERCDGSDADCDGTADEGCPCTLGMMQSCGTDDGACRLGTQTCSATGTWGACTGGQGPITESCNGADDDCDGMTDEPGATGCVPYVRDVDGDGSAEVGGEVQCLCGPTGPFTITYSSAMVRNGDCDDDDATVHPGAPEVCDGVDDDCDGTTDEMDAVGCVDYWLDLDGDGYGYGGSAPSCLCAPTVYFRATEGGDCCEYDSRVHPGVTAWFVSPMSSRCGAFNYDFDCSGSADRRWTAVGGCGGTNCTASQGWADVPNCGQGGNWLDSCVRAASTCLPDWNVYFQECH